MSWPLAIVAMVFLLAGIYYYVRLVVRLFSGFGATLRERGYKSPALKVGLAALAFGAAVPDHAGGAGLRTRSGHLADCRALRRVAAAAGLRRAAIAGEGAPGELGGGSCAFPIVPWATPCFRSGSASGWPASPPIPAGLFQIGTVSIAGGLGCLAIARRAAQPDAAAVLAQDPRPPVIYLRPFQQEEEIFAQVPWQLEQLPALRDAQLTCSGRAAT